MAGDDTLFPSNYTVGQRIFSCWTAFACLCHNAFMEFSLLGRLLAFFLDVVGDLDLTLSCG